MRYLIDRTAATDALYEACENCGAAKSGDCGDCKINKAIMAVDAARGVEPMALGYNDGVTAGIRMAYNLMLTAVPDIQRQHRKLTPERIRELRELTIKNRELFREDPRAFIRFASDKFEAYVGKYPYIRL